MVRFFIGLVVPVNLEGAEHDFDIKMWACVLRKKLAGRKNKREANSFHGEWVGISTSLAHCHAVRVSQELLGMLFTRTLASLLLFVVAFGHPVRVEIKLVSQPAG